MYVIKKRLLLLLFIPLVSSGQKDHNILTNKIISIYSEILNEERTCLISFPDLYYETSVDRIYPIIILLDGYTYFKTVTGIVHFMSSNRVGNNLIPESIIIIAIENVDRRRDFTLTKIKTKRPNTGGGGKFLNFIEKELIPYIDENYRTESYRTLIGHSLGGLLTLNSYMHKFSVFNTYIAIDPSIWWNEEMMKNKVDSISSKTLNKKNTSLLPIKEMLIMRGIKKDTMTFIHQS